MRIHQSILGQTGLPWNQMHLIGYQGFPKPGATRPRSTWSPQRLSDADPGFIGQPSRRSCLALQWHPRIQGWPSLTSRSPLICSGHSELPEQMVYGLKDIPLPQVARLSIRDLLEVCHGFRSDVDGREERLADLAEPFRDKAVHQSGHGPVAGRAFPIDSPLARLYPVPTPDRGTPGSTEAGRGAPEIPLDLGSRDPAPRGARPSAHGGRASSPRQSKNRQTTQETRE